MNPSAHRQLTAAQQENTALIKQEEQLFFTHLDLIRAHEQQILENSQYFFCQPAFASYGLFSHSGIRLGTLLIGWRDEMLLDTCPDCQGIAFVYHFGGLLSRKGWAGYCQACKMSKHVWSDDLFCQRWDFASSARNQTRDAFREAVSVAAHRTSPTPKSILLGFVTRGRFSAT
jgi:hypothetical protein